MLCGGQGPKDSNCGGSMGVAMKELSPEQTLDTASS